MCKIILLSLACLAYVCYGRQVRSPVEKALRRKLVANQRSTEINVRLHAQASFLGTIHPLKRLAFILLAWSPLASFNCCGRGLGISSDKANVAVRPNHVVKCLPLVCMNFQQSPDRDSFSEERLLCRCQPEISPSQKASSQLPRRQMLQAAALSTAGLLAAGVPTKSAAVPYELVWQPRSSTPVGSVRTSYAPTFITYLARFLLNYDRGSAGWWVDQARGLPVSLDRSALKSIREKQFGQFSESIEVGLQKYQGKHGVVALFTVLRNRYGTSPRGKVQLALLFSLIAAANQPRKAISRVLGEGDDGSIESVKLTAQGTPVPRLRST